VKVITNPEIWLVRADGTHLLQVLMNLSLNARDAMPEGGTLMIETENHAIDSEYGSRVAEARPGRFVMISVGDTGVGIPEEVLARIFEPFFTTKDSPHSFGMGLAAANGIVKAHRGWIEVLTHPGAGSNFRVFLPRYQDTPEAQSGDQDRPVLLVVDDSENIRRMSRKVLEESGFCVLLAEDAQEAMRLFALNRGGIQGLVLDLSGSLKSAMSLVQQVRELAPSVPVLITVGYAPGDPLPDLKTLGARLLSKPFSASELVAAVQNLLSS
jgi:hypothetical protein